MAVKKKRTIKDIEKRLGDLRDAGRPWRVKHYIGKDKVDVGWSVFTNLKVLDKYEVVIGYGLTKEDAHFIANAAEDVEFLLNKLKRK